MRLTNKKVGGLRFVRLGHFCCSFSFGSRRPFLLEESERDLINLGLTVLLICTVTVVW